MVLPRDLRQRLIDVARSGLPNEVCGYVAGDPSAPLQAQAVYPVENSLASPIAFALDGQSMIDAEERIDENGHEIIAVFHSHPTGPPVPSMRDTSNAAAYDPQNHLVHVIVSLQEFVPQIRIWRYTQRGPVELLVIDEQ